MCVPSLTVSPNTIPCTAALVTVSRPPHDTFGSHARYSPPRDFTRALYIPRHDSTTSHLPLYDVAESYQDFIRDTVFGSYLHSVKLSYMEKPRGDDMDAQVEYLVDASKKEEVVEMQVQRRSLNQSDDIKANAWVLSFDFRRMRTLTLLVSLPHLVAPNSFLWPISASTPVAQ
ncbi:hypothetical protein BDV34DRAFT_124226 [Aspergillus parasiticus]|uniref:Uncharacterized protein n=1 Tax=Aspergillus parasiticus TaxID=5067 RepID=A0A5N6E067_ASPPA|nr:hypothetical protein BDV34DRAFT_124226 [Aspergillus parasiticus]